jgi:hypothetical protein
VEVEAPGNDLDRFVAELPNGGPRLAHIAQIKLLISNPEMNAGSRFKKVPHPLGDLALAPPDFAMSA